jgi:addiction module RelE/StbE family toxin
MWRIHEEKSAAKALDRAPWDIQLKYQQWKRQVAELGPESLRAIPGYRDEALKGEWHGARSARLNIKWRVIYTVRKNELNVLVFEVTAHDYRKKG